VSYQTIYQSPLGPLMLQASDEGLQRISLITQEEAPSISNHVDHAILISAVSQLAEYFEGSRTVFNIHIDFNTGTEFMQNVWRQLLQIPYGTTISYLDLARAIATPEHTRAVGMANGKNPIPIVVPCHRVIGSNGTLTGYALGLKIKNYLLTLETAKKHGVQATLF
jgi:methylated-DNA-[protein]-cysteine S-methyltransferase